MNDNHRDTRQRAPIPPGSPAIRPAGRRLRTLLMAVAAAAVPVTAGSHGGEDHGDETHAAPAAAIAISPRATAQTEDFEMVISLENKKLVLSLDRFTTNEPVDKARIEIESGGFKAIATPAGPGIYTVPGETFAGHARYPLTISVQAGDSADLLTATLDLSHPEPADAQASQGLFLQSWLSWPAGVLAILAALLAAVVLTKRRKAGYRG